MYLRKMILLTALAAALAGLTGGVALAAPEEEAPLVGEAISWPAPATSADTSVLATDSSVRVPDAKLKAALVSATKLAAGKQLQKSDLMKLAGGLDLSGKGIASADGLQYCVNVTAINLSGNKLTSLPSDLKNLVHLDTLSLAGNRIEKFPEVLGELPALTTLSLKGNALTQLPATLNTMLPLIKYLDMSGNKVKTIPNVVGKLANLETLYWANNGVESAPLDLFKAAKLVNLDLSGNLLETLPKEAATSPALANLDVRNNILTETPAGLGAAPAMTRLYARDNRLTGIEASLCTGKIKTLQLDINRIAKLPAELSGKAFDQFSIEWNQLDLSPGSEDLAILESVTSTGEKAYTHQLAALKVTASQATRTTVVLRWQPVPDGTDGDTSWTVAKYYVYNADQETWKKLAELDSMAGMYVVTGLGVDTPVRLMVGVEYNLNTGSFDDITRNFTEVEAQTLAQDDPSPAVENTPSAQPTQEALPPEPSASATTEAPVAAASTAGPSGGLVVALIIMSLVAIGAVASLIYMSARQRQKKRY